MTLDSCFTAILMVAMVSAETFIQPGGYRNSNGGQTVQHQADHTGGRSYGTGYGRTIADRYPYNDNNGRPAAANTGNAYNPNRGGIVPYNNNQQTVAFAASRADSYTRSSGSSQNIVFDR